MLLQMDVGGIRDASPPGTAMLSQVDLLCGAALLMDAGVSHEQWAAWKECHTARQFPLALRVDCVCVRSRNLTEVFAVQPDVGSMAGVFGPTHLPASGTNQNGSNPEQAGHHFLCFGTMDKKIGLFTCRHKVNKWTICKNHDFNCQDVHLVFASCGV